MFRPRLLKCPIHPKSGSPQRVSISSSSSTIRIRTRAICHISTNLITSSISSSITRTTDHSRLFRVLHLVARQWPSTLLHLTIALLRTSRPLPHLKGLGTPLEDPSVIKAIHRITTAIRSNNSISTRTDTLLMASLIKVRYTPLSTRALRTVKAQWLDRITSLSILTRMLTVLTALPVMVLPYPRPCITSSRKSRDLCQG